MGRPYQICRIILYIFNLLLEKKDETKLILNKVWEYNKESYLILGHNFDVLNNIYNSLNKIVINYLKKIYNI